MLYNIVKVRKGQQAFPSKGRQRKEVRIMRMSDLVARYINDILERQDGEAEIRRNELATTLGCVPSQINYVITSRFTPEQGYIVESRRGGGGYIRITRIHTTHAEAMMHIVNSIGKSLDKATAEVMPMVDQVEFHPGYIQRNVLDYCRENGIVVEAWSPLGSGRLLADPLVNEIGAAHGKSAAQTCVRYALQHGIVPLPKSVTPERIAANADVFDFALTDAEMTALDAMPETGYSGYHPDDAPAG